MITLYDADRCPFCARVRIVLAEKGLAYETVVIDLDNRPDWLYEKNPVGKVPVLEEDGFVLPESAVIMEYLDDRYPEQPLLPAGRARAVGPLVVEHRARSLVSVAPPQPAERPEEERFPLHRVHRGGRRLAVDPLSRIRQATAVAAPALLHWLLMADRTAPERRNHAVTTRSEVVLRGNRRLV